MKPHLEIGYGIPSILVSQKKLLPALSVYYVLRSLYPTGMISVAPQKIKDISAICSCSPRTLYNRINELKSLKLLVKDKTAIRLESIEILNNLLGYTKNGKMQAHKISLVTKPEYVMRTLAIKECLQMQEKAIAVKLAKHNKNLTLEEIKTLNETYLTRLINAFKYSQKSIPIDYNPDVAISQKGVAKIYGLKSQSGGHYWQKVLLKYSLIEVENRLIESEVGATVSPLGKVYYSRKKKKTFCQMPNKVILLLVLQKID